MDELHSLLKRQIKKYFKDIKSLPPQLRNFLRAINLAYHQFDNDRNMLERSLDLSSEELINANAELRKHHKRLEKLIESRTSELQIANRKLTEEVLEREKSEIIQKALLQITHAGHEIENLRDLLSKIREILGTFLDTNNFFVALYNKTDQTLTLPYFVDDKDHFETLPASKTLTAYVIKCNHPVLVRRNEIDNLVEQGEIELIGTPSRVWLGVPLYSGNEVIGVVAVQSYDDEFAYDYHDLELLKFISNQIGSLIERKKRESDLKYSESRFKALSESITEIFYALDSNLVYTYWNKESENFTGTPASEVIGKSIYEIFPKIKNTPLEQTYHYVLNTGKPRTIEHTFVKEKEQYYLESNVYPLSDGLSVITKNVTNSKLARKAVEKYSKDLEALNSSKDKFFSIIAHDLKSPFISLLGFSEILDEDVENLTIEELKYYSKNIHKSAKGLLNLLENLLEWSRIHTGRMKFYPMKINLGELITSVKTLYRENAARKDITLELDYDPDLHIFADLNMIESVLRNLLSNAIKFTMHGGKIKIYAFQNGNQVKVSFEDNGVGISKEDLGKLFKIDQHVSHKGTEEEEGTGLGLILCKEFVEKNQGSISVESEQRKGSKFIVSLPVST